MKKIFSTLSLLAIILLAGTSCSNDEIEINDSQLTFTINLSNVMKYDGVDIIENFVGSNAVSYLNLINGIKKSIKKMNYTRRIYTDAAAR